MFNTSEIVAGATVDGDDGDSTHHKRSDRNYMDRNSGTPSSSNQDGNPLLPLPPQNAWIKGRNKESQVSKSQNPYNMIPPRALPEPRGDTIKDVRFGDGGQMVPIVPSRELDLDVEDLDIPWSDLVLKERIGAGNLSMLIMIILLNVDFCVVDVMPVSQLLFISLYSLN